MQQHFEQELTSLIDELPTAILIISPKGNAIVKANSAAATFFRRKKEEIIGLSPHELGPSTVYFRPSKTYLEKQFGLARQGHIPVFDWAFWVEGKAVETELRAFSYVDGSERLIQLNIRPQTDALPSLHDSKIFEDRLRLMVQISKIACYDWYPQQDFLFWDERMYELFGLDPQSSLHPNQHFLNVLHPDDRDRVGQTFESALQPDSQATLFTNYYRILVEGKEVHVYATGHIFRNEANEVVRIIGSCQDMSQTENYKQKILRQESLIKDTLKQLDLSIKTAKLGVWTLSIESRKLEWNDRLLEIYGFTRDEFEQDRDGWRSRIHPEDQAFAFKRLEEIIQGRSVFDVEFRIVRPGGEIRYLIASGGPAYDKDNKLKSLIGVNLDVTHLKEKEHEAKQKEEQLSLIFNHTYDFMALLTIENGTLVFNSLNRPYLTFLSSVLGMEVKEEMLIGTTMRSLYEDSLNLSPDAIVHRMNQVSKAIKTQKEVRFVSHAVVQGKEYYMQHAITPILVDGECKFLLWTVRNITEKMKADQELEAAYDEVNRLKAQLENENTYLREEINLNFDEIVYQSESFGRVWEKVQQVAPTDANVLILGETGTGKELLARAIHASSSRSDKPMIKVNCGAIPNELIESELFGYEKGAFTGAEAQKAGRFDLAHEGTLFLDEVGELPLTTQAKLLRVLQEGEYERLGATQTTKVNVRILAATNRDLKQEVEVGNFRKDLFFRLNVFPIQVPPLRDRKEDIPPLIAHFQEIFSKKYRKMAFPPSRETLEKMMKHNWPGNVRELQNMVDRSIILNQETILLKDKGLADTTNLPTAHHSNKSLDEVIKNHIEQTLIACKWKIEGKEGAANKLKVKPSTLRDRMKKLDIQRPQK